MVTFYYRKMESKVLGEIYRPVANVQLQTRNGRWIKYEAFIDSGADTALLPYSFGLMLGFKKEIGELHELKAVKEDVGSKMDIRFSWYSLKRSEYDSLYMYGLIIIVSILSLMVVVRLIKKTDLRL